MATALFDSAIFDSAIFDTGETAQLRPRDPRRKDYSPTRYLAATGKR